MVVLVSGAPPRRGGLFSYVVIAVLIGALTLMAATPAGATVSLVKAIGPGSPSSAPQSLISIGNKLLFTVRDARNGQGHGRELWKSDGTAAGTKLLKDIYPGPPSSDADQLTRLHRRRVSPGLGGGWRMAPRST
jgi:ELWxxDGT repeat protein